MGTQRRFESLGNTLLKISDAILKNQELCKLLKYSDNRATAVCPDFKTETLMNVNVRLEPLLPNVDETGAFVVVLLDNFDINGANTEFKIASIRFDVIVPYEDWRKVDATLKPFAIMSEIDTLFNGKRVNGLGSLKFSTAQLRNFTETMGGYTLIYVVDEFN